MPDDRPAVIIVPTELDRRNPFYDLSALAFVVIVVKYLSLYGLGWYAAPLVLIVGIWTLSGEPATDVAFVGLIASAIRNKLGLRRAHEWLFAWAHYWYVAIYPIWRTNCLNLRSWCVTKTTHNWNRLQRASGAILHSRRLRLFSRP